MADILRRAQAPVTEEAWQEIDDTAGDILRKQLAARSVVDVDGPHGWQKAAVDLGRLEIAEQPGPDGVPWGRRAVLPLVEVRLPFTLNQMELDNVSRGATDPDLSALEDAAQKASRFEETVIYHGLPGSGIDGLLAGVENDPIALPATATDYPSAIAQGLERLYDEGIPGPYALILGSKPFFQLLQQGSGGYPARRIVRDMLGGDILASRALQGGVLLSQAEDHFELTLGQDWSIGYASHDRDSVELYLTESFGFRVLEPAAAVELKLKA
jgi:uncharacterized linocin/CFP29 family protein